MPLKKNFSKTEDAAIVEVMSIEDEDERKRELINLANQMNREVRVLVNRYNNYLIKNQSPFTLEEDEQIIKFQKEFGTKWGLIAIKLGTNRGPTSISTRFKRLQRNNFDLAKLHPPNLLPFGLTIPLLPMPVIPEMTSQVPPIPNFDQFDHFSDHSNSSSDNEQNENDNEFAGNDNEQNENDNEIIENDIELNENDHEFIQDIFTCNFA